jgi:hypothetical protein
MASTTETFERFLDRFVRKAAHRLLADDGIRVPPEVRELERRNPLLAQIAMLAHLRRAIDRRIGHLVVSGDDTPEALLDEILGGAPRPRPTWQDFGQALGVSAQSAHRKYTRLSR